MVRSLSDPIVNICVDSRTDVWSLGPSAASSLVLISREVRASPHSIDICRVVSMMAWCEDVVSSFHVTGNINQEIIVHVILD